MRSLLLIFCLSLCLAHPVVLAQLFITDYIRALFSPRVNNDYHHHHQSTLMNKIPNIFLPGSNPPSSDPNPNLDDPDKTTDLTISDVISTDRTINIFASFTRDISTVSARLDNASQNTTVLAPTNGALQKLPRKPWEDPEDYQSLGQEAYEGSGGEDRAHRNLRRFVEAHAVPVSPWRAVEKVRSMDGGEVWWEEEGGDGGKKKKIMPGDIEVSSIVDRVSNGEVWVIKGCMNYKS